MRADGAVLSEGALVVHHHLFSSALVTAEVDAVRDRLPSERLHPLRASRRRALVAVYFADQTWQIGAASGRFGALGVAVMVTRGDRPLPPLAPVAASARAAAKSGYGWCYLEFAATNTTARDILTDALGLQGFVADLHIGITAQQPWNSATTQSASASASSTSPEPGSSPSCGSPRTR